MTKSRGRVRKEGGGGKDGKELEKKKSRRRAGEAGWGESLIRGVDWHTCILPVELTPFH